MDVELTAIEATDLKPGRGRPLGAVGKIRQAHHTIAKLAGAGFRPAEIARMVSRTPAGVRAWLDNPANAELVASYAGAFDARTDSLIEVRLALMNEIAALATMKMRDQLLADIEMDQPIPYEKLVKLGAHVDDRTGLGRQETKVNLNLDLGARLDQARAAKARVDEQRSAGTVVKFVRRV